MQECSNGINAINIEDVTYKEVVVVGSGPSGIILSYILSGNWPYYSGGRHPDEMLTARLQSVPQEKSLIEQDLQFLSQVMEGRSRNPVAVLIDSLNHPHENDINNPNSSLLYWKHHPDKVVDHVVLGKGKPGGCWQQINEKITTISVSSWMQLPGLSFNEWENRSLGLKCSSCMDNRPATRVKVRQVAAYYRDYVQQMRLMKYFRNNSFVKSTRPVKDENVKFMDDDESSTLWEVEGYDATKRRNFKYICKRVVLATGASDSHNLLNVAGELNYPEWVFHNLKHFESMVTELKKQHTNDSLDPIMIIGSGLSAADAVLIADRFNLSVLQVFTSHAFLSENRYPKGLYPEYHQVYCMMKNEEPSTKYTPLHQYEILEICQSDKGRRVRVKSPNGLVSWYKVTFVAIMIGYRPALNFLPAEFDNGKSLGVHRNQCIDSQKNPIAVLPWTYEVTNAPPGLHAMGPLVGDNVVRMLHGGAVAIASHIYKKKNDDAVTRGPQP